MKNSPQAVADNDGGETADWRAPGADSAKGTGRSGGREPHLRPQTHVRPAVESQERAPRAQLELLHVREEAREDDRHRPGEGQDDGPGAAGFQGEAGQYRHHLFRPQREVCQQFERVF